MGRRCFRLLSLVAAAAAVCCTAGYGQIGSAANMQIMQNGQNAKEADQAGDKSFVKKAMQGGAVVLRSSQIALQKSSDEQLKRFAQRMVDDHTKMDEQFKPVAMQLGLPGTIDPPKKEQAMIDRLQSLSGDDFNKAYVKMMLQDHGKEAAAFKQEAANGKLPALKDLAAHDVSVIEDHQQMIQDIAKSMNLSN